MYRTKNLSVGGPISIAGCWLLILSVSGCAGLAPPEERDEGIQLDSGFTDSNHMIADAAADDLDVIIGDPNPDTPSEFIVDATMAQWDAILAPDVILDNTDASRPTLPRDVGPHLPHRAHGMCESASSIM